ncbi:tRNA modification GTPase [Stieleria varia]|uniref:tRNA modification GTPase MnmE n=1 Tax=Stieleria varia TaxID=2528005 RepID=A0A5C6BBZ8_9BACT|nr:tRNA modification GTPase [Stieleria varia]TWU08054.1 tRNA modification GTPase MnmE [Stieleria varia]
MNASLVADIEDTIVAIASPPQGSARGIVRISGPQSVSVMAALGCESLSKRPHHQQLKFVLPEPLGALPVRVLIWPGKRSYTGQPSAEVHTIGCLPILEALMQQVVQAGARPARPGEFTMRSFLAGRIDLTQAEAVLGVIDAGQRGALDHALRQLSGNLSRPLEQMRSELLDLLADVEAGLDFVDEDIEFISDQDLLHRLSVIKAGLEETRQQMHHRGGGSHQPVIALRGDPNAGKSRLLNALAGNETAIVADIAGTTRDTVSVNCRMGTQDVRLVDTAGIEVADQKRETSLGFEAQIIDAAQHQAERASGEANVRLWCVDWTRSDRDEAVAKLQRIAQTGRLGAIDLWVATKCDEPSLQPPEPWIATSSLTGRGLHELANLVSSSLENTDREETGAVLGTAARCSGTLDNAIEAITRAMQWVESGDGHEFVSAELRLAADCLGEVTGAVYTDDILDRVFSRFCIGK